MPYDAAAPLVEPYRPDVYDAAPLLDQVVDESTSTQSERNWRRYATPLLLGSLILAGFVVACLVGKLETHSSMPDPPAVSEPSEPEDDDAVIEPVPSTTAEPVEETDFPTQSPTPATTDEPLSCEKSCAESSKPWTKKCGWKVCEGCNDCQGNTETEEFEEEQGLLSCDKSCAESPKPWQKKCSWKVCEGCNDCQGNPGAATPAPTRAACEIPSTPYGTCIAWGDPHYAATFHKGSTMFDYMGLGVHRLARTADGCFEVQAFQCPFHNHGASVFVAFAIKDGSHVVQVVNRTVYFDGTEVSSDAYHMNGKPQFCMSSSQCEGVGHISLRQRTHPTKEPGFHMNMKIRMASKSIDSTSGTCVKSPPENSSMTCESSLFTSDVLKGLQGMCGMPKCQDPDGYKPISGHEEMCKEAGINVSEAEGACRGKPAEFQDACMYEYCANDGDDEVMEDIPSTTPEPVDETKPLPCLKSCAEKTKPWQKKCGWKVCKGCNDCQGDTETEEAEASS